MMTTEKITTPTGTILPQADDVRRQLQRLGWQPDVVDKVFRGPAYHSIRELAGPETDGAPQEGGVDERTLLPHAESSPRSQEGDSPLPSVMELTQAVWYLLHGEPSRMLALASGVAELTGEVQAYLMAALETAFRALDYLREWRNEFRAQREAREAIQKPRERRRDHLSVAVLEAAVAAQDELPIIGPDLKFALEVGIEIREALLWSLPAPVVLASKIAMRTEGENDGVYAGLEGTKDEIAADPVASLLKAPSEGTRYPFVPSLSTFRREAERLMLYPHQPNSIAPGSERYTWIISSPEMLPNPNNALSLSLQGSEMSMAEMELAFVDADESGGYLYGTLSVGDALGDIETGTLALAGSRQPWPVEYVGIVRLSDKKKWRASDVGRPGDSGRYLLLKFAPYGGDFEPSQAKPTVDSENKAPGGIVPKEIEDGGDDEKEGDGAPWAGGTEPVTLEIYGSLAGLKVPLAVVYRPGTGLVPGGKVLIGETPEDGFGFAGKPGKWQEVFGSKTPADYGLPDGYAVVIYDGKQAWPVHSNYLAMLYGTDWQQVIVGK